MIKKELKTFAETTSMKGVPRFMKAKSIPFQLLWIVAVLSLLGFSIFNCYELISAYVAKPKSIEIIDLNAFSEQYDDYPGLFSLPGMTICNQNPLTAYRHYRDVVSWEEYNELLAPSIGEMDDETHGRYTSPRGYLEHLGPSTLLRSENNYDFILDCWYGHSLDGKRYPCRDDFVITHYPSVLYSQCFEISINLSNPNVNVVRPIQIALTLYLDEVNAPLIPEVGTEVVGSAGVALVTHDSGEIPLWENVMLANAGEFTLFKVAKTHHKKYPDSKDPCRGKDDKFSSIVDIAGDAHNYSLVGCMYQALQRVTMKSCGCINSDYSVIPPEMTQDTRFCGAGDITPEIRDIENLCQLAINLTNELDECIVPCEDITHTFTVTSSDWPSPTMQMAFYKKYIRGKPFARHFTEYETILQEYERTRNREKALAKLRKLNLIGENFAKVEIVVPGIRGISFKTTLATSFSSLLASIGGNLNLWSGISAIIIIELIDVMMRLMHGAYLKVKARAKTKPSFVKQVALK